MRVLHLDTDMLWRGGQQQVLLLAKGLATHPRFTGEAITVCRPGSALAQRLIDAGLQRAEIDVASPWSPSGVWALRRLAREMGVDIIHAHASHAHNLAALATALSGRHLVATRRVIFPIHGSWKFRRCTRVVAISRAIATVVAAAGVREDRIAVIPSGVDPARFQGADRARARAALGLGDGDLMVLCAAALTAEKDHGSLLTAWGRIAAAHPNAHLLLAGDGDQRGALALHAKEHPRVRLLGFRDDIPDLIAAADAFAMTSREEGLGTSVMDAMTCGVPCLATRAGGLPELIEDGVDGLLAPVADVPAISDGLQRLLGDTALRQRLGTAARATAGRRFLASAMVDAHVDLYDRIMRGA